MSEPQTVSTPRGIVLCADDFAASAGISAAVLALAEQGRISATSAMVLAPRWRADAARLRELRGRIDVGLHLDWTSHFARAAGHGQGLGPLMARALLGGVAQQRVRSEIERQLDAFEAAWQAPPDHVDGHQHVQQFAGIREPLVELLARRYGAQPPWLRLSQPAPAERSAKSRLIAGMGAAPLQRLARQAGVPTSGPLSGIYDFSGGSAAYAARMAHWLAGAVHGTLLMCHPAQRMAPSAGDEPEDAILPARWWEREHLASAEFGAVCASENIQIVRGGSLYCCAG